VSPFRCNKKFISKKTRKRGKKPTARKKNKGNKIMKKEKRKRNKHTENNFTFFLCKRVVVVVF